MFNLVKLNIVACGEVKNNKFYQRVLMLQVKRMGHLDIKEPGITTFNIRDAVDIGHVNVILESFGLVVAFRK